MAGLPLPFTLAFAVDVDLSVIAPVLPSIAGALGGTPVVLALRSPGLVAISVAKARPGAATA